METTHIPDCAACEAALCDYLDGTLGSELRVAVEAHLRICPACAAYERESREAMLFLRDADLIEPPPAMVHRILRQIPAKTPGLAGLRGWLGRLLEPVMQPRVVMGAMMTVLSLAMMTRCAGVPSRTLGAADLDPVKVWGAFDDRLHRTWDRTLKAYESMRVVYEIQSRLHDWKQQQEEEDTAATDAAASEALKTRQLRPAGAKPAPPATQSSGKAGK